MEELDRPAQSLIEHLWDTLEWRPTSVSDLTNAPL